MGVCKCAWVCVGGPGYVWKCSGVCIYTWCAQVWVCGWVWDEFSEYLLETRVLTSADFNTYPIQIFSMIFAVKKSLDCWVLIEIVLAVICKNLCQ